MKLGVFWGFNTDKEGWTSANADITEEDGYLLLEETASDPRFNSPSGLGVNGGTYHRVRARVKRIDGGNNWDGRIFYSTSEHGFSASFVKDLPGDLGTSQGPPLGEWLVLEWNMSELDVGGTDWVDNTISGLRLDLGGDVQVDWVAIVTPEHAMGDLTQLIAASLSLTNPTFNGAVLAAAEALEVGDGTFNGACVGLAQLYDSDITDSGPALNLLMEDPLTLYGLLEEL